MLKELQFLLILSPVPPGIISDDNKTALLGENITLAFTVFAIIEQIIWHFQANGDENFISIDIFCGELVLLAETNSTLQLFCNFREGAGFEVNLSIIGVTPEAAGSYILNVTDRSGITVQNTSILTVQPFDVTQCGKLCDVATVSHTIRQIFCGV